MSSTNTSTNTSTVKRTIIELAMSNHVAQDQDMTKTIMPILPLVLDELSCGKNIKEHTDVMVSLLQEMIESYKQHLNVSKCIVSETGNKYWRLNGLIHRVDGPAIEYANGSKSWYRNGRLHREDGPAIDYFDGYREWWLDGKQVDEATILKLQEDKKNQLVCRTDSSGGKEWYLNGKLHREDGPAIEFADGYKVWYLNGKEVTKAKIRKLRQKKNLPISETDRFGNHIWTLNGYYHRTDGPAKTIFDGSKYWYLNGLLHREDGPAIEFADGDKAWFLNGKRHREDGPAYEGKNGYKAWWVNGKPHRENGPTVEREDGTKEWWHLNGKKHREDGPAVERTDGRVEWWWKGKRVEEDTFVRYQKRREFTVLQKFIEFNKDMIGYISNW